MLSLNSYDEQTKVINSRANKKRPVVWRRRQGTVSGMTFTTYERPSLAENKPITRADGSTDLFNLGKLLLSVSAAFTHNKRSAEYDSLWLAQTIEDTLSMDTAPLTPATISTVTYHTLKRFDELAALQYAARHHLISTARRRGRPTINENV